MCSVVNNSTVLLNQCGPNGEGVTMYLSFRGNNRDYYLISPTMHCHIVVMQLAT